MAKEQQNTAPDAAAPAKPAAASKKKKEFKKKKERRTVPHGLVHVSASFNNTQITITDPDGRVLCNSSAGAIGFKGSRKGTPYAAQQASLSAASSARDQFGMKSVEVRVKGPGSGRESAVRALAAAGLHIVVIRDVTPIPHNGCRPPKRRRVYGRLNEQQHGIDNRRKPVGRFDAHGPCGGCGTLGFLVFEAGFCCRAHLDP